MATNEIYNRLDYLDTAVPERILFSLAPNELELVGWSDEVSCAQYMTPIPVIKPLLSTFSSQAAWQHASALLWDITVWYRQNPATQWHNT
jgi:hypothetical protein